MTSQNSNPTHVIRSFEQEYEPHLDAAREALEDLNERVVAFAKERPVATVVIALATGFVLGKLVSKL